MVDGGSGPRGQRFEILLVDDDQVLVVDNNRVTRARCNANVLCRAFSYGIVPRGNGQRPLCFGLISSAAMV